METEIKERWKWGEEMEIQSTCGGEDSSVHSFSDEIRNRMCKTLRIRCIPLISEVS